jgi:WD40 repeat protein
MWFRSLVCLMAMAAGIGSSPAQEKVADWKAKYTQERAEAVEKKFPLSSLEKADELAKRADTLAQAGNEAKAISLYREARWLVPYVPTNLPPNVDRVLGISRMRHGDQVLGVAYSPDGSRIVTTSKDYTTKIWDLSNGREVRTYYGVPLPKPEKAPDRAGVTWSPDGKLIASTVGNDIHLWNPETGQVVKVLKGHEKPVWTVAFSPDSKQLVSGSDDKSVRLWDVAKGEQLANLNSSMAEKARGQVNSVAFSPNGKLIVAANSFGQMQIWNPAIKTNKGLVLGIDAHPSKGVQSVIFGRDSSVLFTSGDDDKVKQIVGVGAEGENISGSGRPTILEGTKGVIQSLALSRDGKHLAGGSDAKNIVLWDLSAAIPRIARIFQGHTGKITSVAFSPDGKSIVSGSEDQTIKIWPVSLSDDHQNFADHKGSVWTAAFSPNGEMSADAGVDRVVYLRDAQGKVLHRLEGNTAPVTALAFSLDSTRLASVGGDKVVRVWETSSGKLLKEMTGSTAPIMAVVFGDKNSLLTGGIDKVARLWDIEKGSQSAAFPINKSAISSVSLSRDGKLAAVGSGDGMVRVYELKDNVKELYSFPAHHSGIGALTFSQDGTRLATCGGDGLVRYWSLSTFPIKEGTKPIPQVEFNGHSKPVTSVALSGDGRFLASGGGDQIVRIWEIAKGTEMKALRGHKDWITTVAFRPNSSALLSASVDGEVKIWELSSEQTTKPYGHTGKLNTIAVSRDGKLVATGSEDKTIKVWDVASGLELFTLDAASGGHDDEITALSFAPNSKQLISAGKDHKLIIWDLENRKVLHSRAIGQFYFPYLLYANKGDKFLVWQSGDVNQNLIVTYDPNGAQLSQLDTKDKEIGCMTFSTDGEMAALGFKDGSVQLWLLGKNERIGGDWPAFENGLGDLAVTPDKKTIIASDTECQIKIYNIEKKQVSKTFQAHKGTLLGIVVGPEGGRFASICENREVKLWKTETGEELRSWTLSTPVSNIAFSADGKKLIAANADSTIYVLDLP